MRLRLLGIDGATSIDLVRSATKKLTISETAAILVKTKLTEEKQKEILVDKGLSETEAKLALEKAKNTSADIAGAASARLLAKANANLKASFNGLGKFISTNKYLLVIAAIGAAISAMNFFSESQIKDSNSAKEAAEKHIEKTNTLKDEEKEVSKLIERYKELASSETINSETRTEIRDIQKEINSLVSVETQGLDLVNGQLDDQLAKLKEIQKEQAKQNLNDYLDAYSDARTSYEQAYFRDVSGAGWAEWAANWAGAEIVVEGYDEAADKILKNVNGISAVWDSNIISSLTHINIGGKNAKQSYDILNNAIKALENDANYDHYNSVVYAKLKEQRSQYEEVVGLLNETSLQVASGVLNIEAPDVGIDVNDLDSFKEYRDTLIQKMLTSGTLQEHFAEGLLTSEDIQNIVDEYLAETMPDYYEDYYKINYDNIPKAIEVIKEQYQGYIEGKQYTTEKSKRLQENFNQWLDSLSPEEQAIAADLDKRFYTDAWDIATWAKEIKKQAALTLPVELDIPSEQEALNQIKSALQENWSATGLTEESISNLQERYKDLESYDASKLFVNTANGIKTNTKELRKLEKEYEDQYKLEIDEKLKYLVEEYNKYSDAINECTDSEEIRKNNLIEKQNVIAEEINETSKLASQYKSLTSAYNKWLLAKDAGDSGDTYDSLVSSLEDIKELYEQGLVGEAGFREYVDILSGKDLSTASLNEVKEAYEELQKKIAGTQYTALDFLEIGGIGVQNFLKAIQQVNSEWVKMNEDGTWQINLGKGVDEQLANIFGVSLEFIQSMIGKLGTYNVDVEWGSSENPVLDAETSTVVYEPDTSIIDNTNFDRAGKIVYTPIWDSTPASSSSIGVAKANGGKNTIGDTVALGGEEGQEIVVRDGKYFTIGDKSAEFFQYKKGDIVFNANQTRQLLSQGKITSGLRRGRAFASGTSTASTDEINKFIEDLETQLSNVKALKDFYESDRSNRYNKPVGIIEKLEAEINMLQEEIDYYKRGAANGGSLYHGDVTKESASAVINSYKNATIFEPAKASSTTRGPVKLTQADGTKEATVNKKSTPTTVEKVEDSVTATGENASINVLQSILDSLTGKNEKTIFDWIEIKIDRIQRKINKFKTIATSAFNSVLTKNNAVDDEISSVNEEIDLQEKAKNKYLSEANKVGLDEKTATKVREGNISIEDYSSAKAEKIEKYKEYYEKYLAAEESILQLQETENSLYQEKFNNIQSDYENQLKVIENLMGVQEHQIDMLEAKGYLGDTKHYATLIDYEEQNISKLNSELSKLQSAFAEAMSSGTIEEGSDAWYQYQFAIEDVKKQIDESNLSLVEYSNTMRDIDWSHFDFLQERISQITQETEFLIELMSNSKLYNDKGQFSDKGMATMGLHATNYNVYMEQAKQYAEEMARIQEDLAKDPYNTTLIERREELLELQQESILAAEDEKQAIVDMVEEGINLELESLQELIDSYKESLDSAKDLYDYQKQIADQTSNIASLQKQLAAYEGDISEENKARVQQLRVELEKAESDLEETEYERYISDQEELLDELYLEYEEILNQRLDDVDSLIEEMINTADKNTETITDTLKTVADGVGYKLSQDLESALGSSSLSGIKTVLDNISANVSSMVGGGNEKSSDSKKTGGTADTTPPSPSVATNNSSDKKETSSNFFISKKDNYPKSKLNYNGSIVDRLRYKDYDASFSARTKYYSAMGFKGTYTGSSSQNSNMLQWMKANGFSQGGYVADLQRIASKNGDDIITFNTLKRGEAVLTPEQSIQFSKLADNLPKLQGLVDISNYLSNIRNKASANAGSIRFGDTHITIPIEHVEDYNDFVNQLRDDKKFERFIQSVTIDQLIGNSSLAKNKYKW